MTHTTVMTITDLTSDVSVVESEEDEELQVMDPSDPRAHGREGLEATVSSPTVAGSSRWDDDEEDVDEDLGVLITDSDDNVKTEEVARPVVQLSEWAKSRFLVSRKDRVVRVTEDLPIVPLNDFILSDFGTRFRGNSSSNVPPDNFIGDTSPVSEQDDQEFQRFTVGAPLFSESNAVSSPEQHVEDTSVKDTPSNKSEGKKKRPENRYFITDVATKCFNCGEIGHVSAVCMNDKVCCNMKNGCSIFDFAIAREAVLFLCVAWPSFVYVPSSPMFKLFTIRT